MTTLLHIDSSPLGDASVSRELTRAIVAAWREREPATRILTRDVAAQPLDHLSAELMTVVKFRQLDGLTDRQAKELALTDELVDEFLSAELLVIGAPMYNFSIPTQLKAWLDRIVQAGRTFRYGESGPVGLATGKKAVIASSRGGVYSTSDTMRALDHQEAYLRTVLGFVGITDVSIIRAEGVAMGPDAKATAMAAAERAIAEVVGLVPA